MPYQNGYVPEYYGGSYANGQQQQQSGGQARQPGYQLHPTYQQPSLQSQTPYATPQYFGQGQASYYQPPTSGTYNQQPYLSPPQPAAQHLRYSPDPLHQFQAPPQPRQPRQPQQQGYHPQPQQRQAHRPVSQSSHAPQASPPQSSQRRTAAGSPQWPKTPWSPSPYETSVFNASSAAINSQVHAPVQQNLHTHRQPSQMTQGYAPSPSEVRRPSPVQHQQSQARPPHRVLPPQEHRQVQASQQRSQYRRDSNQAQPQSAYSQPGPDIDMSDQAALNTLHQNLEMPNPPMIQRQAPASRAPRPNAVVKLEEPSHVRSPKRRRSNDGTVVPICKMPESRAPGPRSQHINQEPGMEKHDQAQKVRQPPSASSPLTELASSQMPPTPTPRISIDYQSALLALSDDYISAAYNLTGFLSSAEVSEELLDQYQSLLATGMGCLDSVLKNYRNSDARKEARIRLRYASLLYEETENLTDAEECLSKGITLCERAHLTDLKYAMHHLTARIWFKSGKFKTAMKTAEKLSTEAEKLQLLHWVYGFYFLRVSFGLQVSDNHHETVTLVRHLTALSAIATRHYHVSVQILASTLEALVYLRARTQDSVDLASRAIASARMHQLTPEMTGMPQVRILLDSMDVACSLVRFDRKQADVKLQAMHAQMDESTTDAAWVNSHGCALHIGLGHSKDGEILADTGGIFEVASNRDISLAFSWLTKGQAYTVGYLITGLSKLDGSRANEALKWLNQALTCSKREPKDMLLSQSAASGRRQVQIRLRATARLYVAFAFCGASKWDQAQRAMDAYLNTDLPLLESKPDATTVALATYLDGMIKHAQGELDSALETYRSAPLQVNLASNAKGETTPVDPIKILAALNSIEILHLRGQRKEAGLLLDWTEPYCRVVINSTGNEHGSKAISALFSILKAAASHRSGGLIIETKALLQKSVAAAQVINNVQLLMVIMVMMTELYFKNIVGQQALNSGKSSSGLANKSGNKLWVAMANGMYADTVELCGHKPQADEIRRQAQQHMASLPETVRNALQHGKT